MTRTLGSGHVEEAVEVVEEGERDGRPLLRGKTETDDVSAPGGRWPTKRTREPQVSDLSD
jgi:hypothetical protein